MFWPQDIERILKCNHRKKYDRAFAYKFSFKMKSFLILYHKLKSKFVTTGHTNFVKICFACTHITVNTPCHQHNNSVIECVLLCLDTDIAVC